MKNRKPITIMLALFLLCALLPGCKKQALEMIPSGPLITTAGGQYYDSYNLMPLCAYGETENLSVSRVTHLDVCDYYTAAVQETFTVYNSGQEAEVSLVYPALQFSASNDGAKVYVDNVPCEEYWGVELTNQDPIVLGTPLGEGEYNMELDKNANRLIDRMNDGTYFHIAFPNWPELSSPSHSYTSRNTSNSYYLAYFLRQVTIPAGGNVEVTVSFTAAPMYGFFLNRLDQEISYQSHSLELTFSIEEEFSDKEEQMNLIRQTITDPTPTVFPWKTAIPWTEEYYYILLARPVDLEKLGLA